MLAIKRVLGATDFSPCGDAVLPTASRWAATFEARLHLLHVLEIHGRDPYNPGLALPQAEELNKSLETQGWSELEERRRRVASWGIGVDIAQRRGLTAAPVILEYAEESDIDLIVLCTHGRRGLRHFLLGSVAEEVVQRSDCPILTFRDGEAGPEELPQRILVPVDLSEHSASAVAHAKELAAASKAELQLLHVLLRPSFPVYYEAIGSPDAYYNAPELQKEAEAAMEGLYESCGGPPGPYSIHVAKGLAVEEILRFTRENSSDLLVIASHGLTGLSHLLLGSVAERVVRQAPCPVLTLKSFGRSLLVRDAA